jgi:hypothetical protein
MSVGHVGAGYMDGLSCCIVLVMIFTVTQKTVPGEKRIGQGHWNSFFAGILASKILLFCCQTKQKTTHVNKQWISIYITPLKQNEPPIIMHRLTSVCIEEILSLIDSDKSAHEICSITGIGLTTVTHYWSEHRPQVPKPSGGRSKKLTDANLHHATCLIRSGEADNAVQVTQSLRTITNQSLSPRPLVTT